MTFMKSMIQTYFALIFFFLSFLRHAALSCSFFFFHPSLDVARLGLTLLITRNAQNVLYLLG